MRLAVRIDDERGIVAFSVLGPRSRQAVAAAAVAQRGGMEAVYQLLLRGRERQVKAVSPNRNGRRKLARRASKAVFGLSDGLSR